jgi:hypothetical protein
MDSRKLFYRLYLVERTSAKRIFRGTAFPIAPDGTLLTCRHVAAIEHSENEFLAVLDNERDVLVPIEDQSIVRSAVADIALIRNALGHPKSEFFPLLTPRRLSIGADIYTFGYFCIGGQGEPERGYFGGKVVNISGNAQTASLTLPFPVLEGMSGSPVLIYHNGVKVVGLATGNRSSRILASETVAYDDKDTSYRETVNRIVEFGTAHHVVAITSFLDSIAHVEHIVTDQESPAY